MTLNEAVTLRDEYVKKLTGKPYDGRRPDWAIKDVIVADEENAENVYAKMYEGNMSNENALSYFSIPENNYDALIVAHPWPRVNGDIMVESVQHYLANTSF